MDRTIAQQTFERSDFFLTLDFDRIHTVDSVLTLRPTTHLTSQPVTTNLDRPVITDDGSEYGGPGPALDNLTTVASPNKRRRSRSPPQDRRLSATDRLTDNASTFSRSRAGSSRPHRQYSIFPAVSPRGPPVSSERRPRRTLSLYERQRCEQPSSLPARKSRDVSAKLRKQSAPVQRNKNDLKLVPRRPSSRGILRQIQDKIRSDKKYKPDEDAASRRASLLSLHAALNNSVLPSVLFDADETERDFSHEFARSLSNDTQPDPSLPKITPTKSCFTSPAISAYSFEKENTSPPGKPNLDSWNWQRFYVEDTKSLSLGPAKSPPIPPLAELATRSLVYTGRSSSEISPMTTSAPNNPLSCLLATPRRTVRRSGLGPAGQGDVTGEPQRITLNRMQVLAAVKGLAVDTAASNSAHGIVSLHTRPTASSVSDRVPRSDSTCQTPLRFRDSISHRNTKVSEIRRRDLRKRSTAQHVALLVDDEKYAAKKSLVRSSPAGVRSPDTSSNVTRRTFPAASDVVDLATKPLPRPPTTSTAAVESTNADLSNFIRASIQCRCACQRCECACHQHFAKTASPKKRKSRSRRNRISSVMVVADSSPNQDHGFHTGVPLPKSPRSIAMTRSGIAPYTPGAAISRVTRHSDGMTDFDTDVDHETHDVSTSICTDIIGLLPQGQLTTPPLSGRTRPESQVLSQHDISLVQTAIEDGLAMSPTINDNVTVNKDPQGPDHAARNATFNGQLSPAYEQPTIPPKSALSVSNISKATGLSPIPSPGLAISDSEGSKMITTPIDTSFSFTHHRGDSQSSQTDYDDLEMTQLIKSIVTRRKNISPNTSRRMYKFIPTRGAPKRLVKSNGVSPANRRSLVSQLKAIDLFEDELDIHTALRSGPGLPDTDHIVNSAPATLAKFNFSTSDLSESASVSAHDVEVNHCLVSSAQMDHAIDTFLTESAAIEKSERGLTLADFASLPSSVAHIAGTSAPSDNDTIVIGENTSFRIEDLAAMLHQHTYASA